MDKTATIDRVWAIFGELNKIPRPSHHEEKAADFLCQFATANGLGYSRDANNCVVIRKPATPGCEDWEPLVLLNHMDMVCVHDSNYKFNALEDPIVSEIHDGWMYAKGTSLGADNGIGLSIALALISDNTIQHGPLEVLTTTNEEDGMSGAANLPEDFIKGRKVINLDSEDFDTITVGAAGAYIQKAEWHFAPEDHLQTKPHLRISIEGGKGGHSGVDIDKGHGNAIVLLFKLLNELKTTCNDLQIGELQGGGSAAAIAGKASATLCASHLSRQKVSELGKATIAPFHETDSQLTISVTESEQCRLLGTADSQRLITAIAAIPNGVLEMREDMPGTVQTSTNIGVLKQTNNQIEVTTHTRSFSDQRMEEVGNQTAEHLRENGANVSTEAFTPAWQENSDSFFLKRVGETFKQELGFAPRKVAMHFVLEAGHFVRKYPGIEIACIGPRIESPHSTGERVELKTVEEILKVARKLVSSRLKTS